MSVIEFFSRHIGVIGLILISPALYRLAYGLTMWLGIKLVKNKKDFVIKHYHNGKLVSETIIKADAEKQYISKSFPSVYRYFSHIERVSQHFPGWRRSHEIDQHSYSSQQPHT